MPSRQCRIFARIGCSSGRFEASYCICMTFVRVFRASFDKALENLMSLWQETSVDLLCWGVCVELLTMPGACKLGSCRLGSAKYRGRVVRDRQGGGGRYSTQCSRVLNDLSRMVIRPVPVLPYASRVR